jgi:uncharacterized SAM-binding protein YcdF (DUF218 family)
MRSLAVYAFLVAVGLYLLFLVGCAIGGVVLRSRLKRLLKLRYPSIWEEAASAPDVFHIGAGTVSVSRILKVMAQHSERIVGDLELQRTARHLKVASSGFVLGVAILVALAVLSKLKIGSVPH